MSRRDELSARVSALRYRSGRAAFEEGLRTVLGPRAAGATPEVQDVAARLCTGFRGAELEADDRDWAVVRAEWTERELSEAAAALTRFGHALGQRPVWLL